MWPIKKPDAFRVESGNYETVIKLDSSLFDSYQDSCIEAATLAVERLSRRAYVKNIFGIYTVVEQVNVKESKPRFIALTYLVLRNASMPSLSKEFEKATEQYQKLL